MSHVAKLRARLEKQAADSASNSTATLTPPTKSTAVNKSNASRTKNKAGAGAGADTGAKNAPVMTPAAFEAKQKEAERTQKERAKSAKSAAARFNLTYRAFELRAVKLAREERERQLQAASESKSKAKGYNMTLRSLQMAATGTPSGKVNVGVYPEHPDKGKTKDGAGKDGDDDIEPFGTSKQQQSGKQGDQEQQEEESGSVVEKGGEPGEGGDVLSDIVEESKTEVVQAGGSMIGGAGSSIMGSVANLLKGKGTTDAPSDAEKEEKQEAGDGARKREGEGKGEGADETGSMITTAGANGDNSGATGSNEDELNDDEEDAFYMVDLARAIEDEDDEKINHAILTNFFKENDPERIGEVDTLLQEWKGREDELFAYFMNLYMDELQADTDAAAASASLLASAQERARDSRETSQEGAAATDGASNAEVNRKSARPKSQRAQGLTISIREDGVPLMVGPDVEGGADGAKTGGSSTPAANGNTDASANASANAGTNSANASPSASASASTSNSIPAGQNATSTKTESGYIVSGILKGGRSSEKWAVNVREQTLKERMIAKGYKADDVKAVAAEQSDFL